jgi:hypothetical protein
MKFLIIRTLIEGKQIMDNLWISEKKGGMIMRRRCQARRIIKWRMI